MVLEVDSRIARFGHVPGTALLASAVQFCVLSNRVDPICESQLTGATAGIQKPVVDASQGPKGIGPRTGALRAWTL